MFKFLLSFVCLTSTIPAANALKDTASESLSQTIRQEQPCDKPYLLSCLHACPHILEKIIAPLDYVDTMAFFDAYPSLTQVVDVNSIRIQEKYADFVENNKKLKNTGTQSVHKFQKEIQSFLKNPSRTLRKLKYAFSSKYTKNPTPYIPAILLCWDALLFTRDPETGIVTHTAAPEVLKGIASNFSTFIPREKDELATNTKEIRDKELGTHYKNTNTRKENLFEKYLRGMTISGQSHKDLLKGIGACLHYEAEKRNLPRDSHLTSSLAFGELFPNVSIDHHDATEAQIEQEKEYGLRHANGQLLACFSEDFLR